MINNPDYMSFDEQNAETKHIEKVHMFFDTIEQGAKIFVQFPEFPEFAEETQNQPIKISVVSLEMARYDYEYLSPDPAQSQIDYLKYRPYFSFFHVDVTSQNLTALRDMKRSHAAGRWHLARMQDDDLTKNTDYIKWELDGTYVTAASPINCVRKRLLIFDDRMISQESRDEINFITAAYSYDFTGCLKTPAQIQNILELVWDKADSPQKIDIYNVGHGNADYIRGQKSRILYDIGYEYRKYPSLRPTQYPRAAIALRCLEPSCVILSHWDLDHIIGCAYAKRKLFGCPWIAPNLLEKTSVNAKRLARYLACIGRLFLVERKCCPRKIADITGMPDTHICLWQCYGRDQYVTSKENCTGLVVEIKKGSAPISALHVLLAGDVPYGCLPDVVLKSPIHFLHVPHHCSKMTLDRLQAEKDGANSIAVISTHRVYPSTGPSYLEEDGTHKMVLGKKFHEVLYTVGTVPCADDKNLSIQFDCRKQCYKFR